MTGNTAELLQAWRQGDQGALAQLMRLLYDELHRIAHGKMMDERQAHTLQPSALLNEAYLRLLGYQHADLQNRHHFLVVAAQAMRRVLIDHARARLSAKRGGGEHKLELDEAAVFSPQKSQEIVALEEALGRLEAIAPRKARIVELRYFAGLSVEETAQVLAVAPITVMREWKMAKAWLYAELKAGR